MTTVNLTNIRRELVNILRNGNVFTTTVRGATTQTDTITASAGSTITLTKTQVRNIRSLTVNAVSKTYIKDFTFVGSTGVVTFVAPFTGGETVIANYDYSAVGAEKVYPDMPRDDLTLKSFPRVGIQVVSMSTVPFGLGGRQEISDILITVFVWMQVNKDTNVAGGLGGTEDLMNVLDLVRDVIRTNEKLFYTVPFIYPLSLNPIIPGTNNKLLQCSMDFNARFITEIT